MENLTLGPSLAGGALIGLAAVMLMAMLGRIAGVSGILGGILSPGEGADRPWRLAFVLGILSGPLLLGWFAPEMANVRFESPWPLLVIGGFLVGFGTRMGSGCTSGHGVCGISRLSRRGIVATTIFMAMGMVTVAVVRHVLGDGA